MRRKLLPASLAVLLFLTGCSAIIQKRSVDFQTTAMFLKPCKEIEKEHMAAALRSDVQKKGFFSRLNPATYFKSEPRERIQQLETTVNDCYGVDLEKMLRAFLSIKETDRDKEVVGDTFDEVRAKGFTLYEDRAGNVRRQNTSQLYSNEALAAIGMPVNPPPLKTDEIAPYQKHMLQYYGEKYIERDMHGVVDRICLNQRDSLSIGSSYELIIVWESNHVVKRVIKGGPINNPKTEKAFLGCIAEEIGELLKGGVNKGMNFIK